MINEMSSMASPRFPAICPYCFGGGCMVQRGSTIPGASAGNRRIIVKDWMFAMDFSGYTRTILERGFVC